MCFLLSHVAIYLHIFAGVRDWHSFHRYAINFAYLEVSNECYIYQRLFASQQ